VIRLKINLPENVELIIRKLNEAGHEAYAVGGCIRDVILGRVPNDWDITTSAVPCEIKKVFRRTFDTGIKHGTISVLLYKDIYEITTYRIDGEYLDCRHPSQVLFSRSLKDDLKRRDFTMNALAYNDADGLIDLFNGLKDIDDKVIRAVGNPYERFTEDALRILRGIRFSSQLGFTIDEETKEGMKGLAPNLKRISAERIQEELVKLLVSDRPDTLRMAYKLGVTKVILPEFDKMMETTQETIHHDRSVGEHTIKAMLNIRADKVLRLTMLCHDMGKPALKTFDKEGVAHFKKHSKESFEMTKVILRRLKFDNDTYNKVTKLVYYHDYRMEADKKHVRRAINKIGKDLFPLYIEVRRADALSQSEFMREEKLEDIDNIERLFYEILSANEAVTIKDLAINGKDLINMGVEQGTKIGEILSYLLELVLNDPELNDKEKLQDIVKEKYM
jgi:tRNA nucleotidyltransferase (CCA-adding enzyme)